MQHNSTILFCNPISDSYVHLCNFKFWDNLESNVGDKVWSAITNLGLVAKDKKKDFYSMRIAEMETKDKTRFNGKKMLNIGEP